MVIHWSGHAEDVAPAVPASQTVVVNAGAPAAAAPPGTGAAGTGLSGPLLAARTAQAGGDATGAPAPEVVAGGAAVRLGDVATVTDDVEDDRVAGWFDGQRTVIVIVRRQLGTRGR